MEKLVRPVQGTRFIGISNFNTTQIEEVLKVATIKPKYNEFEIHPYLPQEELVKAHTKYDISVIAYAPLGNTNPKHNLGVSARGNLAPALLTNPVIDRISKARGCKPSQTVLAWNLARGLIVIPKASQSEHQKDNIATLDQCKLTAQDIKDITALRVPLRLYENACSYGLTDGCAKVPKKF
jgi:alcohol dehydrogenase (NADP+)